MFAPFKPQANAYSNIHVETGVHGADRQLPLTMAAVWLASAVSDCVSELLVALA